MKLVFTNRYARFIGALAALAVGIIFIPTHSRAQLQQSGGPGTNVTITAALPAGSNQIGHVVADSGSTTAVTQATGSNLHAVIDSGAITATLSGAVPAGTNVIGTVNTIPKTACGNTVASQALAAVPTSSTAVFSSTTCLQVIVVNNTNSTSATVTVSDNAGTPINDVLTFSIPANSQLIQPLWGVAFSSGVKWSASGTGLTGALLGYQ
ncbi:MAG TPA: hypothetical protein VND65_18295 [Candidatus Binatia bacterium]|nr:hypothetical protein [Candidatus Binatia bacterium]